MQIRAAVARSDSPELAFEDLELDEPRPDEVLVRLVATGICQTDAHVWHGRIPAPRPIVLGHEGAGIVERVGTAVTSVRPGDRVVLSYQSCGTCRYCLTGHGAYCDHAFELNFGGARLDGSRGIHRPSSAEAADESVAGHFFGQSSFATYALTTERNTVRVDADIPLELLGPLGCGIQTGAGAVLNSLDVGPGSSLAVFGSGAVGLAAVMAAHAVGATTVVAVDVVPSRLTLATELGATATVDAREHDVAGEIRRIAGAVDHVLDTTGRPELLYAAVDSLAPLGQLGLVAGAGPDHTIPVAPLAFGKSVRGIVQGDAVPHTFIPRLIDLHLAGRFPFDRLVTYFEFSEIDRAFAAAASGEAVKPVVRIAPE